jgi:hypothetical protein
MILKSLVGLLALHLTISTQAQFSVGAEVVLPVNKINELISHGIGPSVGMDIDNNEVFTVFGQTSFDFLLSRPDTADRIRNAFMVPFQGGVKVYLAGDGQGIYGMGLLGGHLTGYTTTLMGREVRAVNTYFSWGLGGGYRTGDLDLSVRYNYVLAGPQPSSYLGLRVGFLLGSK